MVFSRSNLLSIYLWIYSTECSQAKIGACEPGAMPGQASRAMPAACNVQFSVVQLVCRLQCSIGGSMEIMMWSLAMEHTHQVCSVHENGESVVHSVHFSVQFVVCIVSFHCSVCSVQHIVF